MIQIFDKLKEKPHNCPFCGGIIQRNNNFYTHNYCFNHGHNVNVGFQYVTLEHKEVYYIKLSNSNVVHNEGMILYISKNYMRLSDRIHQIKEFPFDNSITPENFEEKINFYMLFS